MSDITRLCEAFNAGETSWAELWGQIDSYACAHAREDSAASTRELSRCEANGLVAPEQTAQLIHTIVRRRSEFVSGQPPQDREAAPPEQREQTPAVRGRPSQRLRKKNFGLIAFGIALGIGVVVAIAVSLNTHDPTASDPTASVWHLRTNLSGWGWALGILLLVALVGWLVNAKMKSAYKAATLSLVCGVVWLLWVGSILALVFGYVALKLIRRSGLSPGEAKFEGRRIAIAGIVLGWIGVATLAWTVQGIMSVSQSPEASAKSLFCRDMVKVTETVDQMTNGTLTNAETVSELDSEQSNLKTDSYAFQDADDATMASKVSSFSDALGRLKVAVADGGDVNSAASDAAVAMTSLDARSVCPGVSSPPTS